QAVSLYRGPLLAGCTEEWVLRERLPREQACLQALETLAEAALTGGDLATAERFLSQAAALDPLRDTSHRALMAVLAAEGNHSAAIQVYHNLRRRLGKEINAEPDPETQALFEQLRAGARGTAG